MACYNTRPGNEVDLFYNAPEPTQGAIPTIVFTVQSRGFADEREDHEEASSAARSRLHRSRAYYDAEIWHATSS